MQGNKTVPTDDSVTQFLNAVADEKRRQDSQKLLTIMSEVTGEAPQMWGSSIVGFGVHHYKYATGREGDIVKVGFAPRKQALVLYGLIFYEVNIELLKNLGPHTAGKGCLYIKDLDAVDLTVLKDLILTAYASKS